MPVPSRRNSGHIATPTSGEEAPSAGRSASPIAFDRAGRNGAAHDHDVASDPFGLTTASRGLQVSDRPVDVGEVGPALGGRGRADAQKGDVRTVHERLWQTSWRAAGLLARPP